MPLQDSRLRTNRLFWPTHDFLWQFWWAELEMIAKSNDQQILSWLKTTHQDCSPEQTRWKSHMKKGWILCKRRWFKVLMKRRGGEVCESSLRNGGWGGCWSLCFLKTWQCNVHQSRQLRHQCHFSVSAAWELQLSVDMVSSEKHNEQLQFLRSMLSVSLRLYKVQHGVKNYSNGKSLFPHYSGVCQLPVLNWLATWLRVSDSMWQSFPERYSLDGWLMKLDKHLQTFTKPLPHWRLLFRAYLLPFGTTLFAYKLPVLSSEVSLPISPSPERLSISTTSILSPSSPDRLGRDTATCTTPQAISLQVVHATPGSKLLCVLALPSVSLLL